MSHSKSREVRQLGTLRHSFSHSQQSPSPSKLDRRYEGISGNAISVSSPKVSAEIFKNTTDSPVSTEVLRKPSNVQSSAVCKKPSQVDHAPMMEKKVTEKNSENKKLKDVIKHEKELQQRLSELVQLTEKLRSEVKDRDACIADLNGQLLAQNEKYKILFEKEQSSHEITRKQLETVKTELNEKFQKLEELKQQHASEMRDMTSAVRKCETEIVELKASKEKELQLRDEKLAQLKKQMAEALDGNSKERHQQLGELSKELGRVQEEAELLKLKLRNSQKISKERCSNCEQLNDQLKQMSATVKDEERQKNNLKEQITALKKQLSEISQSKTVPKHQSKSVK